MMFSLWYFERGLHLWTRNSSGLLETRRQDNHQENENYLFRVFYSTAHRLGLFSNCRSICSNSHDSRVSQGFRDLLENSEKSDLFLDIGYISSFTFNETRMISPFIEVRPGIFILMGMFDILGTFRIFLCAAMLWKFSEKLYTQVGIKVRQPVSLPTVIKSFNLNLFKGW